MVKLKTIPFRKGKHYAFGNYVKNTNQLLGVFNMFVVYKL